MPLLLFFISFLRVSANTLTLHAIKSPKGFDWTSPQSLINSSIKNKLAFESHFMGHLYVDLNCQYKRSLTGMTTKNLNFFELLFWDGTGFGIFYHTFTGEIEKEKEILQDLDTIKTTDRYEKITFIISEAQCSKLKTYQEQLIKYKIDQRYGLAHRPLMAEGAGCSSYAMSFLDVLNQVTFEMKKNLTVTIKIPEALIGEPLFNKRISLLSLYQKEWARDDEKHRSLTFWDPDKMVDWARLEKKRRQTQELIFDISHYPAPQENPFKQDLKHESYLLKSK